MRKYNRFLSIFVAVLTVGMAAYAATPANPRTATATLPGSVRQSAVGALTRSVINKTRARIGARTRNATTTTRTPVSKTNKTGLARTATSNVHTGAIRTAGVSRAATNGVRTNARTGKNTSTLANGLARAGVARATAVFNDVSKIGSGYAQCRESYATCMDQMCANANDTYRRCFCSERFTQIRNTENALDQAMIMLQQFQDNNLNAVDKTAAEVNAMYTATVGEEAIKRDTSASAQLLNNIEALLSGKTVASVQNNTNDSLSTLDFTNMFDNDDIWNTNDDSIFATKETDMSTMEGSALFNAAQKQCVRLTQNNCENDAVFNMSKSSYNILITQDCNTYEKTLDKKKETLTQAVRTAEKYLREARLEEYRSHNSADVNECLTKVRSAMLADTACGEDYKRCLDPTGAYISAATGEPIYTPRLFELENTISLNGVGSDGEMTDVLSANKSYENFLENYRKYVTRELDTCRDIADFVWTEFKRTAIIEIAQAQSAKLEEVRSSCVNTIAECYDTTSDQLVDFADDDTSKNTSVTAGALGRYTAASMCKEKVIACATLYAPAGSNASCKFDGRGHLVSEGDCGLQSLLNYVKTVDSINITNKCDKAIEKYLTDLCTPTNETQKYPYKCRTLTMGDLTDKINLFAKDNCTDPGSGSKDLDSRVQSMVDTSIDNLKSDMLYMFAGLCEDLNGLWYDAENIKTDAQKKALGLDGTDGLTAFYSNVFGRGSDSGKDWGMCYQNTDRVKCLSYNTDDEEVASWNVQTSECEFKDSWYANQCSLVGGYYENALCYIF